QGHAQAQSNLGVCYDNGNGVPEDDVTAYMWYNLSHAQGNDNAKKNKDIIAKRMTKEQIAEGQKLSREWQERFDKREKK
ncbi:MAG: sel1 repeat family protein, partial [Verrucomicrobia bacterium]|nr:sel1 repeat family protein [Verrucomicrobiota bacterium]